MNIPQLFATQLAKLFSDDKIAEARSHALILMAWKGNLGVAFQFVVVGTQEKK